MAVGHTNEGSSATVLGPCFSIVVGRVRNHWLRASQSFCVVQNAKLREENMALTERLRFIEQELQHAGLQLQH